MKSYPLKCEKKLKIPDLFPMKGIALQSLQDNCSHLIQIFVIELAESGSFSNMKNDSRPCFENLEKNCSNDKKKPFSKGSNSEFFLLRD